MIKFRYVNKTKTLHKCVCCGKDIPIGSQAINGNGLDYDNFLVNDYTHISKDCWSYFVATTDMIDECDIAELIPNMEIV